MKLHFFFLLGVVVVLPLLPMHLAFAAQAWRELPSHLDQVFPRNVKLYKRSTRLKEKVPFSPKDKQIDGKIWLPRYPKDNPLLFAQRSVAGGGTKPLLGNGSGNEIWSRLKQGPLGQLAPVELSVKRVSVNYREIYGPEVGRTTLVFSTPLGKSGRVSLDIEFLLAVRKVEEGSSQVTQTLLSSANIETLYRLHVQGRPDVFPTGSELTKIFQRSHGDVLEKKLMGLHERRLWAFPRKKATRGGQKMDVEPATTLHGTNMGL